MVEVKRVIEVEEEGGGGNCGIDSRGMIVEMNSDCSSGGWRVWW